MSDIPLPYKTILEAELVLKLDKSAESVFVEKSRFGKNCSSLLYKGFFEILWAMAAPSDQPGVRWLALGSKR